MKSPSKKELKTLNLSDEKIEKILRLTDLVDDKDLLEDYIRKNCPETFEYVKQCYSDPYYSYMWRVTLVLHAIDSVLNTYGVELFNNNDQDSDDDKSYMFEYCNTGEPYDLTIIYDRNKDELFVGSIGNVIEEYY